ncbi:hypothetical protein C8F01DRAFT_1149819 [Mycena amicta]|nr:hypothetical protein C8F01DRAFT_1149819 [Mycena amicta]
MTFDLVATFLADAVHTYRNLNDDIRAEVRTRLEWTWGLEYGGLEEHLRQFADAAESLLADERMIVIPPVVIVEDLLFRDMEVFPLTRKAHVMQLYDTDFFHYFVVPLHPTTALPARRMESRTPPHIALVMTVARLERATRHELMRDNFVRRDIVKRVADATQQDPFYLTIHDVEKMDLMVQNWTRAELIPKGFSSGESDTTLVDNLFRSPSPSPPYRKILPVDLPPEPCRRATTEELNAEIVLVDVSKLPQLAHLLDEPDSGSECEDDSNPSWAADLRDWVKSASHATEENEPPLVDQSENSTDGEERTRTFDSVDLTQPDYLRHAKRRRVEA